MATEYDRDTGLPVTAATGYKDQSYDQRSGTRQVTGPRLDTASGSVTDRTYQTISSNQSGLNTTPAVLAALDSLIAQLQGRPAVGAKGVEEALSEVPELVFENRGRGASDYAPGYKNGFYRDPLTGKTFSIKEGEALNAQRQAQRQQIIKNARKNDGVAVKAREAEPGGTPEQRQRIAERQTELVRSRAVRDAYSKDAAFADSQALVNQAIARAMEEFMPVITRGSEGAGTSKATTAALLAQRAAAKGAVEGAALGVQAAGVYGGIQNQLAGVAELLTRADPNDPTNLLLQAIIGSKGLVQETSGSQSTAGTSIKDSNQVTQQGEQTTDQTSQVLKQILNPMQVLQAGNKTPQQVQRQAQQVASSNPAYYFEAHGSQGQFDNRLGQVASTSEAALYDIPDEEY